MSRQETDSRPRGLDRRDLFKLGAGVAAGLIAQRLPAMEAPQPQGTPRPAPPVGPFNPVTAKTMPTRNLGKTGFKVGLFSLGCQASLEKPNNEAVAIPILERALDLAWQPYGLTKLEVYAPNRAVLRFHNRALA